MTTDFYVDSNCFPNRIVTYNSSGNHMITASADININSMATNVSANEYKELKDDSKLLYALIDAGVEGWPGYQEALSIYRETE